MLKLVFVDMDGTFVNSAKEVTSQNMHALDLAASKGVQFVPCTGRNITGLPPEMVGHPSVHYACCCNGALICDVRTGDVLHEVGIDKQVVRELFAQVAELPITFDIFADGLVYTLADRWHYLEEMPVDEASRVQLMSIRTRYEGTLDDLLSKCGTVCRINIFFMNEDAKLRVWNVLDANPVLRRASSLPCNVEVTDVAAHKGAGLLWLCDYLGIDPADTIAFGDSSNDVTMLKAAGDGVAMANSLPVAVEAADHMTASCDDSGVARYLEPILTAL